MDNWKEYVDRHYQPGRYGFDRLVKDTGIPRTTIRNYIERTRGLDGAASSSLAPADILPLVRKGTTVEALMASCGQTERVVRARIEDLRDAGHDIIEQDDFFSIPRTPDLTMPRIITQPWGGERIIRFGVACDPHIGSKYAQYGLLHQLFDTFKREGIDTVYCPGDVTEGYHMRPGHEHEVHAHGADEQVDWVARVWPDVGIRTRMIIGNHDLSHHKSAGVDVGKMIARRRSDIEYLGALNARVQLTPNCSMDLTHPLDGAAYALSYSLQKAIDAMSGGEKPNITLNGHHHKLFYLFYRNIHAFECGTTEAQTPWMRGKRIAAHMGGWIIEIHVNDAGEITRLLPEIIPFYRAVPEDWRNFAA